MDAGEVVRLLYDKDLNVFYDEGGFIIWNIFSMVTPNDILLFRLYKEYMRVPHQNISGAYCELIWSENN